MKCARPESAEPFLFRWALNVAIFNAELRAVIKVQPSREGADDSPNTPDDALACSRRDRPWFLQIAFEP
jgi:hypothetical protein